MESSTLLAQPMAFVSAKQLFVLCSRHWQEPSAPPGMHILHLNGNAPLGQVAEPTVLLMQPSSFWGGRGIN